MIELVIINTTHIFKITCIFENICYNNATSKKGDYNMDLSMYERKILDQFHNDIKLRLPEAIGKFEQSIQNLSMDIDAIQDYMIIEAIKLDRELPQNQRVFSIEEEHRCLQKIKEKYFKKRM